MYSQQHGHFGLFLVSNLLAGLLLRPYDPNGGEGGFRCTRAQAHIT